MVMNKEKLQIFRNIGCIIHVIYKSSHLSAFIPLWMYTLGAYLSAGTPITLPFPDMAATLAYIIVPVALGLLCNRFLPKVAKMLAKIQKVFLPLFIIFIIVMGKFLSDASIMRR